MDKEFKEKMERELSEAMKEGIKLHIEDVKIEERSYLTALKVSIVFVITEMFIYSAETILAEFGIIFVFLFMFLERKYHRKGVEKTYTNMSTL